MQTKHQQHLDDHSLAPQNHDTQHAYLALENAPEQIYLAQVPNPTPVPIGS